MSNVIVQKVIVPIITIFFLLLLVGVGGYAFVKLLQLASPREQNNSQQRDQTDKDPGLEPQEPPAVLKGANYGKDGEVTFTPDAPLP